MPQYTSRTEQCTAVVDGALTLLRGCVAVGLVSVGAQGLSAST